MYVSFQVLFKGLIMDRCVLLTPTPECVVSPRRTITRAQPEWSLLGETTHTYPWIIPIITWCRPFAFVPTNILLIKNKLKLNSRAIAAGVAMSPRNLVFLGGFFCGNQSVFIALHQSGVIAWRPRQHRRSCGVFKAEFLSHTVLLNENGEFYTYGIYPYLNRSVFLLMGSPTWWRFSFCSSESSLVCSIMTWRTARARISNLRSPM